MQVRITNNEINAHNEMHIATLEAMQIDKEIIKNVKEAFIMKKEFVIKTDNVEVIKDENGLYINIDESVFIDASKVWCKHVPMIVVATQNLLQTIRMFRLEWFEKIDKKFSQLQDVIYSKMKTQEKEDVVEKRKLDEFDKEMLKLLFKDGVSKVTVKMKDGEERVIRHSLDDEDDELTPEEKIKTWNE